MKKIIISVLALAALTGVSVASERDHDSRLSDPSYAQTSTVDASASQYFVNDFAVATYGDKSDFRRLDEKNGSRG